MVTRTIIERGKENGHSSLNERMNDIHWMSLWISDMPVVAVKVVAAKIIDMARILGDCWWFIARLKRSKMMPIIMHSECQAWLQSADMHVSPTFDSKRDDSHPSSPPSLDYTCLAPSMSTPMLMPKRISCRYHTFILLQQQQQQHRLTSTCTTICINIYFLFNLNAI